MWKFLVKNAYAEKNAWTDELTFFSTNTPVIPPPEAINKPFYPQTIYLDEHTNLDPDSISRIMPEGKAL